MSNNIKRDEPELAGGLFLSALKGLVVGIVIVALLALILSAIALRADNPSGLVSIFAIITLCVGAVSVGFAAARWCPANALLSGIVGGAAYIMLIWLLSLFLRGEEGGYPLWFTAAGYVGSLVCSLVGAQVAKPKRQSAGEGRNSPAAKARRQLQRR